MDQLQQRVQIIEMDDYYYKSRSKEIHDVCAGIEEIAGLTDDMKTLVLEQEEYITVIDNNINETEDHVLQAEEEVQEAYEDEPCCNRYLRYALYALGLIVIILCVLLIIKFVLFRN
jgi:t-SNARE complex subunit (syntaxin)